MNKTVFNLLVLSVVGLLSTASGAPLITTNTAGSHGTRTRKEVIEYLDKFHKPGFASKLSANGFDDKTLADELISFQKFHGLNPTGVYDAATEKQLNKPRCGLPDISSKASGRRRRYVLSNLYWYPWQTTLKYRIGSFASSAISQQTVSSRVQQAYQKWMNAIPVSRLLISPAGASEGAQININFYNYSHPDPGRSNAFDGPLKILAHTYYPVTGAVHFDLAELWTDGPNDPLQSNDKAVYFYQIALHELGHSLGLGHSANTASIMTPYYNYNQNAQLTSDDIQGIQAIYGAATTTNPCANPPCQNGGTCFVTGTSSYTCTCPSQWTGTNCNTALNSCTNNPCLNGGTCVVSGSSYTCTCPSQWTGNNCSTGVIATTPCTSKPCLNGGTCAVNGTSYTCTCTSQWSGTNCATGVIITTPCTNNPCLNGGTCAVSGSGYSCYCPSQWTGTNCGTAVIITTPCTNNPCLNGGTCAVNGISYTCTCTSQWSGTNCGTATPCMSSPCQNGGTCTVGSANNYFMCNCSPGWTGTTCTLKLRKSGGQD